MKRKTLLFLSGTVLAAALFGCQNTNSAEKNTEAQTAAAEESTDAQDTLDDAALLDAMIVEDETDTEATLAPITPSDYLISDAPDYVTLGSYDGIEVEQTVYEITDEMVQDRIQEELEMYAEEVEQERPSQTDDIVYGTMTYAVGGSQETSEPEDIFVTLGYGDYGDEFDARLTGVSAGDTLEFSIAYPEDDFMTEWAGHEVSFHVEVASVCSLDVPAYDDTFVRDTVGYTSKEEYEAATRELLELEYQDASYSDAAENLMMAALSSTSFSGYPQELFDACREEILGFYLAFIEDGTEADVYELFGITEEDLESEVLDTVNRRLLVSAYCLENNIDLTEQDYTAFVQENAGYYGEENIVSFEESFTREALVWQLYESTFIDALYGQASITEVPYDEALDTDEFLFEDPDADGETELIDEDFGIVDITEETGDLEEDFEADGDANEPMSAEETEI